MSGLCGSLSGGASTVGSLGFRGAGCCRAPCPSFPLHHVVICFEINACTQVQIDVGCSPTGDCEAGDIAWVSGAVQDSWGRQRRTVQFDQQVQDGAYIRITTCAKGPCSSCTGCGLGTYYPDETITYPDANKLLKYIVDGQDIKRYLTDVLALEPAGLPAHVDGCVYVGCATRTAGSLDPSPTLTCCEYSPSGFNALDQIPWSSEITVGPIGARSFVVGSG